MVSACCLTTHSADASWYRHTIDADSRGADGVRLADVNGDGHLDIVTGWEEGGRIRLAIHPGKGTEEACQSPWPTVTVGRVGQPEDAVLIDLDGDGALDVVSSCEGRTRTMYVHWAPRSAERLRDESAWSTAPIPATAGKQMWMFAAPIDIDHRNGLDLVCGSKGASGAIGWLQLPDDARQLADWRYRPLRRAGWIMSLVPVDMDDDGDRDVLFSDRKGAARGVGWLENPGPQKAERATAWKEHMIGGQEFEVMFLDVADLDQDGLDEVVVATRNQQILVFRSAGSAGKRRWSMQTIPNPFDIPHGKAVRIGDIDLDGHPDIVHTANTGGNRLQPGVVWMKRTGSSWSDSWHAEDISRDEGVKFDLVQLVDVDGDGDRDVIACEERDNLGVFWYENPARNP